MHKWIQINEFDSNINAILVPIFVLERGETQEFSKGCESFDSNRPQSINIGINFNMVGSGKNKGYD